MKHLYLFNPENDLCLANGGEDYMPPPSARLIARDLAVLPLWYGDNEGAVLLPNAFEIAKDTPIAALPDVERRCFYEGSDLSEIENVIPWGWSAAVAKRIRRLGVNPSRLPDKQQLERLRELSNRSLSVELLRALVADGFELEVGMPEILRSPDEVRRFVEQYTQTILKAPWSGSGKGLWRGIGQYNLSVERWSNGIIRRQQFVVGELFQNKTIDFAMQFYSDGVGEVHFAGYSLFRTDEKGAYKGNVLLPDAAIEQRITTYCNGEKPHALRRWLCNYFSARVAPHYKGYFGVDMLCFDKGDGQYGLHPCVEVNLRMTMGMVARMLYNKYIASGREGFFQIDYHDQPGVLLANHLERLKHQPADTYLSLTPVNHDTRYHAWVIMDYAN